MRRATIILTLVFLCFVASYNPMASATKSASRPDNSWLVIFTNQQGKRRSVVIEDAQSIDEAIQRVRANRIGALNILSASRRSYVDCQVILDTHKLD